MKAQENRIAIITLACLCLCTCYVSLYPVNQADISISKFVQACAPPFLGKLAVLLSLSGNIGVSFLMVIIMSSVLFYNRMYIEARLFWYVLGAHLPGYLLKYLMNRPRPRTALVHHITELNGGPGYPSSTVLFCTVFLGLTGLIVSKQTRAPFKFPLILTCGLSILLVCWSRIYLGAHWFSDTLAGCLTGILYLHFITRCYSKQGTNQFKCILNSKK